VTADPDSLADLVDVLAPNEDGVLKLEQFAHVPGDVWEVKTGQPTNQLPVVRQAEPSGAEFEDARARLAKREPTLWQRFGTHPLPFR
jgi:hypothetical protein